MSITTDASARNRNLRDTLDSIPRWELENTGLARLAAIAGKITMTVWCIGPAGGCDWQNFDFAAVPFPEATRMELAHFVPQDNYFGFKLCGDPECGIDFPPGATWLQLWQAADALVRQSGDECHVYIEQIEPDEDGTTLFLNCGS